jgi:hypothetical protein
MSADKPMRPEAYQHVVDEIRSWPLQRQRVTARLNNLIDAQALWERYLSPLATNEEVRSAVQRIREALRCADHLWANGEYDYCATACDCVEREFAALQRFKTLLAPIEQHHA